MFNNIGLPTPRGSGTNGYIQRSLAARPLKPTRPKDDLKIVKAKVITRMDPSLLEHERRRAVELELLDLIDKLKAEGLTDDEIRLKVDEKRAEAIKKIEAERECLNIHQADAAKLDSHRQGELKYKQLQRAAEAFGIKEDQPSDRSPRGDYSESISGRTRSSSKSSYSSRSVSSENSSKRSNSRRSDRSGSMPRNGYMRDERDDIRERRYDRDSRRGRYSRSRSLSRERVRDRREDSRRRDDRDYRYYRRERGDRSRYRDRSRHRYDRDAERTRHRRGYKDRDRSESRDRSKYRKRERSLSYRSASMSRSRSVSRSRSHSRRDYRRN